MAATLHWPTPSHSAEEISGFGDGDRWVPSLALRVAFSLQDQEGSVESFNTETLAALRPAAADEKLAISPIAGARLELRSPAFWRGRSSPSFFISGEIAALSNQRQRIAREGNPTGIEEPDRTAFPQEAILGLGSVTTADIENVEFSASAGLFIPFEIGDFRFALKPALGYVRRRYNFEGRVFEALRPNPAGPTQKISMVGNESLAVDALGPSLELEYDVAEIGESFGASVFIGGAAHRIVGNRDVAFSRTATAPNQGGVIESFAANWTADVDPWIYTAGLGVRLRWKGLPAGWLGGRP